MTGKTSVWTAVRDQYLLPGLSRVGFPGFVESRSFSKKKKKDLALELRKTYKGHFKGIMYLCLQSMKGD